jgi:hypothetical protein
LRSASGICELRFARYQSPYGYWLRISFSDHSFPDIYVYYCK